MIEHARMQSKHFFFALCFHADAFRQLTLVQLTHMLYYRKITIVTSFSFVVAPPHAGAVTVMMCPAADIMVTNDGPPCGLMLISLPTAERSEGDSEGIKALLTREEVDFTCLNISFISPRFHMHGCFSALLHWNETGLSFLSYRSSFLAFSLAV